MSHSFAFDEPSREADLRPITRRVARAPRRSAWPCWCAPRSPSSRWPCSAPTPCRRWPTSLRLRGDVTARGDVLTLGDLVEGAPASAASARCSARRRSAPPARSRRAASSRRWRPWPRRRRDRRPAADRRAARRPPGRRAGDRGGAPAEPSRPPTASTRQSVASASTATGRCCWRRSTSTARPSPSTSPTIRARAASRASSPWASARPRCGSPASVIEMRDVAVLTRTLNRGEPVTAADLTIERRPREGVRPDALASARRWSARSRSAR